MIDMSVDERTASEILAGAQGKRVNVYTHGMNVRWDTVLAVDEGGVRVEVGPTSMSFPWEDVDRIEIRGAEALEGA